ncbi:uncharacterized protein LOC113770697 isoform X2 [Coffea eugenioides]|uniref:Uncharacterized protein isoform X2 n=1 Tax=Coffea arabica TaxID=13443 RepID=A0ABM4UCW2_COFAR|nr:uncharacterized protein LOC113770697 isoform X2 [Coffea eugenioides]
MNFHVHTHHHQHSVPQILHHPFKNFRAVSALKLKESPNVALKSRRRRTLPLFLNSSKYNSVSASLSPLDLTEDNIKQVLADARVELGQLFDDSVGMTGQAELTDLDGPYVKISLRGKFWHKRSTVLARLGNYLKQRIPEILEVDIEDEKQLDDSPENF